MDGLIRPRSLKYFWCGSYDVGMMDNSQQPDLTSLSLSP